MAKSSTQIVQKFQRGVSAAGPDYAAGVQNPKADWLAAFTAAQPRMAAGLQQALSEGRAVKRAQAKGGTANWQSKASTKGQRNYVAAAAEAAMGYQAVADKIISAGEAARNAAKAMPNATYEQRKQRALAAMDAVSKAWK